MMPVTQPSQHAVHSPHWRGAGAAMAITAPQHFLYFLPLPQGHGSLRPTGICDEGLEGASSILAGSLATPFLHPENPRLARLSLSPPVAPARYKPARRKDGGLA